MPLGREVGLGPGDIVLHEDPTLVPGTAAADKPASQNQLLSYPLESLRFWRRRHQ